MSALEEAKKYTRDNLKDLCKESIDSGCNWDFVPVKLKVLEMYFTCIASSDTDRRSIAKAVIMDAAMEFVLQH